MKAPAVCGHPPRGGARLLFRRPRILARRSLPLDPLVPYPVSPWPAVFLLAFALALFAVTFREAKTHAFEVALLILVGAAFFVIYADMATRRTWRTMLAVRHDAIGRLRTRAAWRAVAPEEFPGDIAMLLRGLGFTCGLRETMANGDALEPDIRGEDPDGRLVAAFARPGETVDARTFQAMLGSAVLRRSQRLIVVTTEDVVPEVHRMADSLPESIVGAEVWDLDALAEKVRTLAIGDVDTGLLPWARA